MGDSALHAELSPSKRHRWGACPGSIRLEHHYPEPPTSPAALDGTRSHALLEECIKAGVYVIPDIAIGSERTDEHGTWTVDAGRVERVNLALNYINRQALAAKSTPIAEQRVFPDGLVGRADLSGTIDVQIPHAEEYEVIDYKDGMMPVDVEFNPQLEQYVTGVLASLETPPLRFRITVIQPKLAVKGMDPISSWVITTSDILDRVVPHLIKQAAATDAPDAPLIPGEDQCKYCRAKGACPALGSAINEVIDMYGPVIDVEAVTVQPIGAPQALAQRDPHSMTDAEMCKVMEMKPLITGFLDAVEGEVSRRMERGQHIEGLKLVSGRGSRSWARSEDETVKVLTGMGIPKAKLFESKLVTPAKAEKLTWDKKGDPQKLSDIQLKRLQAEYIIHSGGKPTVALASDPREAINPHVAPMFAPIEAPTVTLTSVPSFLQALPPGMAAPLQDLVEQITAPVIPAFLLPPVVAPEFPDWMK